MLCPICIIAYVKSIDLYSKEENYCCYFSFPNRWWVEKSSSTCNIKLRLIILTFIDGCEKEKEEVEYRVDIVEMDRYLQWQD